MKPEVHKLRVNVKSLAAEAKFIREEIKRAKTPEARNALHDHRMLRVRPEARLAHLALAFVKGQPYKNVEPNAKSPVTYEDFIGKLKRFIWTVDYKQVKEWLTA